MIKNKTEVYVLLQCSKCKGTDTYEADLFYRSHYKEYARNGNVSQSCCGQDGSSNTPHKIIGYFIEKTVIVSDSRVLNKLLKLKGKL
jgi:hypothetical protein